MKNNNLKNLLTLSTSLFLLISCSNITNNSNFNNINSKKNDKVSKNTVLSGLVDFETETKKQNNFKVKANIGNVASNATVSLSYPSNHLTLPNKTITTGLTGANGNFQLSPNSTFIPNIGDLFVLTASKRLNGAGSPLLSLQTIVQWNGTGWASITYPETVINTKTTAISIIANYKVVDTKNTINTIQIVQENTNIFSDIKVGNEIFFSKEKIIELANVVSNLLTLNYDPFEYIKIQGSTYVVRANTNSLPNIPPISNDTSVISSPIPSNSPAPSPPQNESIIATETFNGKVVDPASVPVDKVKVTAKSLDADFNWSSEMETVGGAYVFRNAPVGVRILITVSKDGWTTRERVEVLKSNLTGDPLVNKFDFDGIYAIQDEPEIISLKINGKQATATGPNVKPSIPAIDSAGANLSGLESNNLEVEMNFSEAVRTDDVQNFFRVSSQNFAIKNNTSFIIDNNLSGVTFDWSNNDRTVRFSTNQAILSTTRNSFNDNEAKYMLEFTQAFRDKTDKEARSGKYIRFNPANEGDFNIFSVKNDETDPKLLSIIATDGGSGNDVLELKFSETMYVINRKSDELELLDPLAPSNLTRRLRVYQTNNGANDNATVLGFSKADNSLLLPDFRGVYTIARLVPPVNFNQTLIPLNLPFKAGSLNNGVTVVSSKITGNTVKLEFSSTAFDRNDRVILSVGRTILGRYQDINNGIASFSLDVDLPGVTNATVTEPSGRTMSTGNATTSANITVNDSQRVSTVN